MRILTVFPQPLLVLARPTCPRVRQKTSGTLLPGETATTSFSFKSADPGVFSDRWRLETAPPAAFVFSAPPQAAAASANTSQPARDLDAPLLGMALSTMPQDKSGGGGNGAAVAEAAQGVGTAVAPRRSNQDDGGDSGRGGRAVFGTTEGAASTSGGGAGVEVGLRGVALAPDTRGHARKRLADGVSRGILAAKVEEIVREVVRGVRTPVREEEVRTYTVISRR